MSNAGWNLDAYPELEPLKAGRTITLADLKGPAVITSIHSTMHGVHDGTIPAVQREAIAARGVILRVYFDDVPSPAVQAPLADFFADGCGGRAKFFSTPYVEKAPYSYNSFIPMPFARSARVTLTNETIYDLANYSFVEYERIPDWDPALGYFHATWKRFAFQLGNKTDQHFFHLDGCGHLLGRAWSVCTDEPLFDGFVFIMEGNNEVRIDGEETPRADYLGTEDSFGFSWGFPEPHCGLYNGINFVQNKPPSMLSIYRFRHANLLRFSKSLDLRIDWTHEFPDHPWFHGELARHHALDRCYVDYATTYYWYQDMVGFEHAPLLPVAERVKEILRPNIVTPRA
jgi:hypothetical protein